MEHNIKKDEEKDKVGNIPKEEISGSDADKAYDENGNFEKELPTADESSADADVPAGSDADTDRD